MKNSFLNKTLLLLIFCCITVLIFSQKDTAITSYAKMELWKDSAIGAIYNKTTYTVAYNKPDRNGNYKIFLSDTLGNQEKLLTYTDWNENCHQWAEEWHPSGEYLFCYVEKTEYVKEKGHKRKSVDAIPGYGAYTDLWLITRDGTKAWKLLELPNNYNSGIIHGAISEDGSLFAWSERVQAPKFLNFNLMAGAYIMNVADFSFDSVPKLTNIRSFKPAQADACNELDDISKDNSTIAFYSTFETKNLLATPIYTLNINTGEIKRLTYESFAQAPKYTPGGENIVYMTGRDCHIFPFEIQGVDWWIMDREGKNHRRLTYMNVKNHPHSVNHYRLAGCLSFVSDNSFLGGVMTYPFGLIGYTVKVTFEEP